jgi:LCP family protein required for cell wall assembly
MSYGDDNATPAASARPHASGAPCTEVGLPPTSQRSHGAAPWERFVGPPHDDAAGHRWAVPPTSYDDDRLGESTECRTDGWVTVADLIAKLGGARPEAPSRHRAAPDVEPPEPASDEPGDRHDAQAASPPVHFSELPDLDATHDARTADRTETERSTVRQGTSDPVAPIVEDPQPAEPPAPKPTTYRPVLVAGRSVAALIAVLALALTGGAWQWSTLKNNRLTTVSALDPESHDIVDPVAQYGDENFLIVGVDSRAGANGEMGAGDTEDAGGARSDTIMLVNIPANRKRVVAVSFPRDVAITPIRCEAWNPDTAAYGPRYDVDTGTYGDRYVYTETKLNSAFSVGGPQCLVKVIQKLSGLSINRFMATDFAGFAKMVDALGGVEVCSTSALRDYELGTVLDQAGRQVIDGSTALDYVRARNISTENNGDYGRIKRQQLFLSSLLRSLISKDTFLSPSKLNNVVDMFIADSYVDNVKTKDLVDLGQSVQGVSAGHITFVTVPTGETDQNGNEPPRTADMRALFAAIINDNLLPGENDKNAQSFGSTSTTPSTTSKAPQVNPGTDARTGQVQAVTTAPQTITVQVSNSTGKTGLATTASDELAQRGFSVMTPDDYPSSLKSTTVFFSPGNERAAATVASAFAHSKMERVTGIGHVVQVVLGPDFSSVSAPPPSGSSVNVQVDRDTTSTSNTLPEDLTFTNAADTTCE